MATQSVNVYDEVCNRIANGEDRNSVIDEYTNDKAFNTWLNYFKSNLENIVSDN